MHTFTEDMYVHSLLPMEKRLSSLSEKLEKCRGKQFLGLCQKTITEIDEKLLGLRKLILMAAAPNAGKTALTIQLALDVLKSNEEACLIYFSLEMQESDIFIRMFCNLSKTDYQTFLFGKGTSSLIQEATQCCEAIGNRLQIIDSTRAPYIDSQKAIALIKEIKDQTKTSRTIVVIDYLQVWPIPQDQRFYNELEIDKWRIGEMKKIRDAINDDPVIVISEARKPANSGSVWGCDLSDVMGSARATYTPDVVFLLLQLDANDVTKLLYKDEKRIEKVKQFLDERGIAICKLDCPKGRDGMERFSIHLKFFYRKNIFKATSMEHLKIELERNMQEACYGC